LVISLIRLEKALDFYERNVEGINLDGLGGVRMAQGIFLELSEMSLSKKLEYKLKAVINLIIISNLKSLLKVHLCSIEN